MKKIFITITTKQFQTLRYYNHKDIYVIFFKIGISEELAIDSIILVHSKDYIILMDNSIRLSTSYISSIINRQQKLCCDGLLFMIPLNSYKFYSNTCHQLVSEQNIKICSFNNDNLLLKHSFVKLNIINSEMLI